MSLSKWMKKNRKRFKQAPSVLVPPLTSVVMVGAASLDGRERHPDLARARLADRYRDAALPPLPPALFDQLTTAFDAAAWRRLMLITQLMQHAPRLLEMTSPSQVRQHVSEGVLECVSETSLLTMTLIRESELRAEEFVRHVLARLGTNIQGEDLRGAMAWIERFNYGKLLEEAERARASGEERLALLRELQEQQERERAPRGKW